MLKYQISQEHGERNRLNKIEKKRPWNLLDAFNSLGSHLFVAKRDRTWMSCVCNVNKRLLMTITFSKANWTSKSKPRLTSLAYYSSSSSAFDVDLLYLSGRWTAPLGRRSMAVPWSLFPRELSVGLLIKTTCSGSNVATFNVLRYRCLQTIRF